MIDIFQRTLGSAICVDAILPPGLWKTKADASALENALINLAINARDAMPGGGRLVTETSNVMLGADEKAGIVPGEYV